MPREVGAHDLRVGVVGRHGHRARRRRIVAARKPELPPSPELHQEVDGTVRPGAERRLHAALVGLDEVQHAEERLARVAGGPQRGVVLGVPDRERAASSPGSAELVVELLRHERVVAGRPQELGKGLHQGGRNAPVAARWAARGAHVLCAERGLVHARDQRGAARRADGRRGEDVRVADALARQAIEVRRARHRVAEGADARAQILRDEQQQVRARFVGLHGGRRNELERRGENCRERLPERAPNSSWSRAAARCSRSPPGS